MSPGSKSQPARRRIRRDHAGLGDELARPLMTSTGALASRYGGPAQHLSVSVPREDTASWSSPMGKSPA